MYKLMQCMKYVVDRGETVLKMGLRGLVIVVFSSVIGILALSLTYLIPTDRIRINIKNSLDQYKGSTNPEWSAGYIYTTLDEYTDASFMLTSAVYKDDDSIFKQAALVPHTDYIGVNNDIIYELSDEKDSLDSYYFNYGRYWHGYLIFLKPLLFFLSLNTIRILNFFLQFFLTLTLIYYLSKKVDSVLNLFAVIVALIILNPISTALNFQLSTVYYITVIAMLYITIKSEKMRMETDVPLLFLVIGISIAYFDFLTYPVVSLALPLLLLIMLRKEDFSNTIKEGLLNPSIYAAFWWGVRNHVDFKMDYC